MRSIDVRNLIAGLILGAIGIYVAIGSLQYGIGPLNRMQAGNFPLLLGIIAIAISVLLILISFRRLGIGPRPSWRPVVAIALSIAWFAFTIERLGLVAAVVGSVALSALAGSGTRPFAIALLAVGLAIGAWLVFVVGLAMPMQFVAGAF